MKPLLSVDNNEAKLRVLSLYKAWSRQLPFMVSEFDIPVNEVQAKAKLREKFMANAHVKDARVIDMMVIKVSFNPWNISCLVIHFYMVFSYRDNKICKKLLKNGLARCTSCQNISKKLSKKGRKISCPSF